MNVSENIESLRVLEKLRNTLPLMSQEEKAYLLGYAEGIASRKGVDNGISESGNDD